MESLNFKNETCWPALVTNSACKKSSSYNTVDDAQDAPVINVECTSSFENSIPQHDSTFLDDGQNTNRNIIAENNISNPSLANTHNNQTEIIHSRSREEILLDRKNRRKDRKTEARILKYEKNRLKNIELHKSKAISIIDRETMNNLQLLTNSNNSCTNNYFNTSESASSRNSNLTRHLKVNDPIKLDISSIIKSKNAKPKLNPVIQQEQESVSGNYLDSDKPQLQRGKKYENKAKSLTKLKKVVLQARKDKINTQCNESIGTVKTHDDGNDNSKNQEYVMIDKLNEKILHTCISKNYAEISYNTKEISSTINDNSDNSSHAELKLALKNLITTLFGFQDRAYKKNPIKANMRRRYVAGFREVLKYVKLNNVCMVLLATDVEKINSEGGITEIISEISCITTESGVPVICALKRREIGYLTHKKVGVSCLAILNKDGAEELFKSCLEYHNKSIQNNKYLKLINIKDNSEK